MKLGKLSLAMGLLAFSSTSHAAITGTAFNDGNGDGIKNAGESGLPEIIINAYDATDTLTGTAISSADGTYTIAAANGGTDYRVEFLIPDSGCNITNTVDFSALGGGGYGTEVQFADGGATGVNYGVLDPGAYVTQVNPTMYASVYANGDPLPAGSSGDSHALVAFKYNDTDVAGNASPGPNGSGPNYNVIATARNIGATGGMAVSKQSSHVYASALLKRHVGLGQDSSGAIYQLDPANPPASATQLTSFIDLDALGFATRGAGAYSSTPTGFHDVIGTNIERALSTDKTVPSFDNSAFGQAGKVSLGDLDISDDGQYLFVTNLYDRKLYRIDLQDASSPVAPTAAQVHRFDDAPWVNNLACTNGVARPYGTKFYRGQIYVGVVCTGENGSTAEPLPFAGDADDLRAYIYAIPHSSSSPGTGATATVAYEFPLNYIKEIGNPGDGSMQGWYRWSDDSAKALSRRINNTSGWMTHNQPILSDIEFDNDGSMMLGFMDRGGHQWGNENYTPGNDSSYTSNYIISGDLLRVYKDSSGGNCDYILEANGVAGPNISNGPSGTSMNGGYNLGIQPKPYQGPGTANGVGAGFTGYTYPDVNNPNGKEFYWGDWADPFSGKALALATPYNPPGNPNEAATSHREVSMGMLAFWPSSGGILSTAMDPALRTVVSGGVAKLSNTTGEKVEGYNIFSQVAQTGTLSKANGMGDVEILLEEPPLEIGNRVWCDSNDDGIQTADETTSPSGVSVTLTCGVESAITTTNASGGYYFNDTNWAVSANTSTVEIPRGSSCVVSIDVSGANETAIDTACGGSTLAPLDQSSGIVGATALSDDARDSDGTMVGTVVSTGVFTTGQNGQSNHSFDFGFRATPACVINQPTISALCNDSGTPTDPVDDTFTYTVNVTGTDVGASYDISGGDTQAGLSYGIDHVSTNSFLITGGDLSLTLDNTGISCPLNNIAVVAPASCSSASPEVDLQISKSVNPTTAVSGGAVTYTIVVTNNGPADATGVEVMDQLPTGVTYANNSTATQGNYNAGTGIWMVGNLANTVTATLTIDVTVD